MEPKQSAVLSLFSADHELSAPPPVLKGMTGPPGMTMTLAAEHDIFPSSGGTRLKKVGGQMEDKRKSSRRTRNRVPSTKFSGRVQKPTMFHKLSSGATGRAKILTGEAFAPHAPLLVQPLFPSGIGVLPRGQQFSIFKKSHAEEAAKVYNYLIACKTFEKFKEDAARLRKILNEGIYLYVVSVAVLHRKDTGGALLPPLWQINPRNYFPGPAIKHAFDLVRRRVKEKTTDGEVTAPAFITGTNRDPEFKLSWWREDCGLNAHHYHWHQSYPWRGVNNQTKDRQGELFYYMHQQMLARYDAERLAVGLMRVEAYSNWHLPIPEGYNPQLTDFYGTYQFSARPANMILADNWRDPTDPTLIIQQEYHRNRILDAINTGKFEKPDGTKEDVDIDGLGAAIEANISTPNPKIYGSVGIHNRGHDILAGITDPDYRYNQAGGVMGDTSAAIRDPIFFRWHKFIDDLFFLHKITLEPYTKADLEFQYVRVASAKVQVKNPSSGETVPANTLTTRMEDVVVDISQDMFLAEHDQPNTSVNVTVRQLNHDEFDYTIGLINDGVAPVKAAIRIFMAPSVDEHGDNYPLDSQRRLFIEMDKFVETLKPGANTVSRSSILSSVIKPRELSIAELKKRVAPAPKSGGDCTVCEAERYCECGWPQHMLVPRGTAAGMRFDVFVMVTNWATDSSTDDLDRGTSYCGVKDKTYPDSRPMGFPFDRKIPSALYQDVATFANAFPNMLTFPVTVKCESGL